MCLKIALYERQKMLDFNRWDALIQNLIIDYQ
jgi:hypothetical protein